MKKRIFSIVLLTLSFLGNHSCEIWVDDLLDPFYFYYVPDDFTTIQEAIDFSVEKLMGQIAKFHDRLADKTSSDTE